MTRIQTLFAIAIAKAAGYSGKSDADHAVSKRRAKDMPNKHRLHSEACLKEGHRLVGFVHACLATMGGVACMAPYAQFGECQGLYELAKKAATLDYLTELLDIRNAGFHRDEDHIEPDLEQCNVFVPQEYRIVFEEALRIGLEWTSTLAITTPTED